jgi:hypothetical protein
MSQESGDGRPCPASAHISPLAVAPGEDGGEFQIEGLDVVGEEKQRVLLTYITYRNNLSA